MASDNLPQDKLDEVGKHIYDMQKTGIELKDYNPFADSMQYSIPGPSSTGDRFDSSLVGPPTSFMPQLPNLNMSPYVPTGQGQMVPYGQNPNAPKISDMLSLLLNLPGKGISDVTQQPQPTEQSTGIGIPILPSGVPSPHHMDIGFKSGPSYYFKQVPELGPIMSMLSGISSGGKSYEESIKSGANPASAGLRSLAAAYMGPTLLRNEMQKAMMEQDASVPITPLNFPLMAELGYTGVPLSMVPQLAPVINNSLMAKLQLAMIKMQSASNMISEAAAIQINKQFPQLPVEMLKGMKANELPFVLPKTFINPVTGQTMEMGAGTRPTAPPNVQKAADNIAKLKAVNGMLNQLEYELNYIPSGRIAGTTSELLSKVSSSNPHVKSAEGLLASLMTELPRVFGEVGNLAAQEQVRAKQAMPNISESLTERARKLETLRKFVNDSLSTENTKIGGMFGMPENQPLNQGPETPSGQRVGVQSSGQWKVTRIR